MAAFPPTRASLLARLRDPTDRAAWVEYIDLYAPLIYAYARRQGLQDADAADLSQEVLRAVAASVGRLEYDPARGRYRNWLFKVVLSKLSNWRAAQASRERGSGDTGIQQLLEQLPAADEGEAEWQAECQQRLVSWACARLRREVTESTWEAFWRTAIHGQSAREVAAQLGLSVGAVYHARSRVLARLKQLVRSAQDW
jgi:RNA polymerase sigma factor (sigma-70 family)